MASVAPPCPKHACGLQFQGAKAQCCSQACINTREGSDMMCSGQDVNHHAQQGMCCCSQMQAALAGSTAPGSGAGQV